MVSKPLLLCHNLKREERRKRGEGEERGEREERRKRGEGEERGEREGREKGGDGEEGMLSGGGRSPGECGSLLL